MEWYKITELEGKTMSKVEDIRSKILRFTVAGDVVDEPSEIYEFYHDQDCCESVYIEDIEGNLSDLVGLRLELAEKTEKECEECSESGTWTFYRFRTVKGSVTVRWLGESNGYYSESVSLRRVFP